MHTPADFDFLSGAVWERIKVGTTIWLKGGLHRNRTPHSFRAGVIEAARLAEGDVGDTAAVMLFMPGEPLLLSELSHRGKTGLTYLCSGKGGLIHLNFAILVDENADRASKLR